MNKSNIIILLKTFSKEELKKFNDFLNSPYFNKNTTLRRYFAELKKSYPEFTPEKTGNEKMYAKIFKGGKYNEQVMKNLSSELAKLCKEFLTIEIGRKDANENKLNLLKQMISRKADSVFHKELKIFEFALKQDSELSERNFYYLYQLEEAKISFHLEKNEQPFVFEKVMKSGEYLILYFLLNLTKTISNLNVNKQSFNVKYDVNLPQEFFDKASVSEIINYMRANKIEFSEIAELYFYRVICNMPPYDENYYFKFKELIMKNLNSLGRIEIYGLFNAMETFCLIKINSGHSEFLNELFDIFNLEIQKGFYKYSAASPVTYMKFRNTYLAGFSLKKYEWVEEFLDKFKNDLIESDRENVIRIARAQLDFERGNFEKVLESIAGIKAQHPYSKIDIRNLTVMSYYELNYTESALSMIDSYKKFIAGNKNMSEIFKESHYRFVNALQTLIISREKNDREKILEVIERLMPYKNERRILWLIGKAEEKHRPPSG